jgi:hypothetical protein
MKKMTIIAVALCVAFMLAVPAMALEIENDGLIRVRGYSDKGYSLDDNLQSTDSYYDMRFRLNTNFKVSDQLWVSTRFRAFNGAVMPATAGFSNIQWERAWMNVKTDFGLFRAGRMIAGAWGNSFADSEGDAFRIRFDTAFGAFKTGVVLQKTVEGDMGNTYSSADYNMYFAYGLFVQENWKAGLLYGYLDNKTVSDQRVGNEQNYKALQHMFDPFFVAKFGSFGLQGEANYKTGTAQEWGSSVARRDVDKDSLCWNLEGSLDFGAGSAFLGVAFASGQEGGANPDDTDSNFGDDWEKLYILAGSTGPTPAGIGSVGGGAALGNFSPTGGNDDGATLIYGGADFKLGDTVTAGVVIGSGKADEVAATWDDDLGIEVDLKLGVKFFDGSLSYTAIAAYLAAGDYWEGAAPGSATFDNSCYALYHCLQLNF